MCKIRFDVSQENTGDTITAIQGEYKLALTANWTPFNVTNISSPETPDITVQGTYDLRVRIQNQDGVLSEWFTDPSNPTFQIGNCGGSASNIAPTANAGNNSTITLPTNSIILNGTGSSDSDGTIVGYSWAKTTLLAGTLANANSASATVTGMVAGLHSFRLTVTDNAGLTDTDDVTITVLAGNVAPNANAGLNQTVTLPSNSVTLSGIGSSDPDGSIASYAWAKTSSLAGTITSPTLVTTTVTGMAIGTHTFQLTVTDNQGLTDTDTVSVTVRRAVIVDDPDPGQCNPATDCCLPDGNGGFIFSDTGDCV